MEPAFTFGAPKATDASGKRLVRHPEVFQFFFFFFFFFFKKKKCVAVIYIYIHVFV